MIHRQSQFLIPTAKETPKDAETISHQLMVRAGLIQKLASGIYSLLPVGVRVLQKLEIIVREEMNDAGACELFMPGVIPAELWQESERWDQYGNELLRLKDRHQRDFVLGPTHEEVITDIARRTLSSYKQLPMNLYQIQTKFRDEVRPRFGVMRGREFIMKDAYSFHGNSECLDSTYQGMADAYANIFTRAGLSFVVVDADSGSIGGSSSQEFMVLAENGEDALLHCDNCDYGANVEKATFTASTIDPSRALQTGDTQEVATPNTQSIDDVAAFLSADPATTVKSLVFMSDIGIEFVSIQGTRDVQEQKLAAALGVDWIRPATEEEIAQGLDAPVGYLGPQGVDGADQVRLWVDRTAASHTNAVVGANKTDCHIINFDMTALIKELDPEQIIDVAAAKSGDQCPNCQNDLQDLRGIEVGHIFKLGTKYSQAMNATVLDQNGKAKAMTMGCYGIGVTRTLAAAIEQNHDDRGIVWPAGLAPWNVHVLNLDPKDEATSAAASDIAHALDAAGLETLLDDRNERAGIKFADADLVGCPFQIIVGKRGIKNGAIELKVRKTGAKQEIEYSDAQQAASKILTQLSA